MIATMDRVEIVFLRSELDGIIAFLQERGVMHLEQVPLALDNHPGYLHRVHLPQAEKEELEQLSYLDQLLKQVLPLLSTSPSHAEIVSAGRQLEREGKELAESAFERHATHTRTWHRELRRLTRRRLNVQDDIAVIQRYSAALRDILPLLQEVGAQLGKDARALVLEAYPADAIITLQDKLKKAGASLAVTRKLGKGRDALVVTFAEEKAGAVDAVFEAEGLRTLSSPDGEDYGASAVEVMKKSGAKLQSLQQSEQALTNEIREFSAHHGAKLVALSQMIANRMKQLTVTNNLAQSKLVGVVHGWVPAAELPALSAGLQRNFGSRAAMDSLGFHDVELARVPTKRENHKLVKPFELIMGMMKPPSYGHFDPTWLVAISFTIFYGFILGDMGYGLVIIAIALWAKKKFGHNELLKDGLTILQYMGISGFIFGFFYWELFGDVLEKITGFPAFAFHRAHETDTLLYLAVGLGAIHIPLSLVIGIREGYAHGHNKHAEEKLGMLLGLAALVLALVSGAGAFPLGGVFGGALAAITFAACIYYLVRGMGAMAPMGVMEIIGLSANVLSYSRLMALGIAGIAFAGIANGMPASSSWVLMPLALLGAIGVHAFNIGLSVFSPTIHSVRLNFVEFLPKFYHPEGRNYEPFRKDMAW